MAIREAGINSIAQNIQKMKADIKKWNYHSDYNRNKSTPTTGFVSEYNSCIICWPKLILPHYPFLNTNPAISADPVSIHRSSIL